MRIANVSCQEREAQGQIQLEKAHVTVALHGRTCPKLMLNHSNLARCSILRALTPSLPQIRLGMYY